MPSEDQDPWYEGIRATLSAIDASVFTTREDKNFVLFGGGVVSWNALSGALAWTLPLEAVAATTGFHWLIPDPVNGGSIVLQDGEFFFVELTRAPQSTQSIATNVGSRINPSDNSLVIAQRIGDIVVFRNGRVIGDGQSIILFGPAVFTQVDFVYGVAGRQTTIEVIPEAIGGFYFDPSQYFPGGGGITREIRFEALISTTDGSTPIPVEAQLRDLTNGPVITNSVISSVEETAPELVESPVLEVGVDIVSTPAIYSVELRMDDTSGTPGPSDQAACFYAALRINWV